MGYIVVGLDGSETSRDGFREAVQEAHWRNARVLAVHVVHFPVINAYTMGYLDRDSLLEESRLWLDRELTELEGLYPTGFGVEVTPHARVGHFGNELIAAARGTDDDHAELLVLGSRGMGGFKGLLLGSVTTYAIHHAPCQILIVPNNVDTDRAGASEGELLETS